MNTTRLTQARRLFASPYVSQAQNRRNARAWCKSIRNLGPRWLLAAPVNKENK